MVIAILPTDGKDDADKIHEQHLRLMKMAQNFKIRVLAWVADGAASELAAQVLMDEEQTQEPALNYEHALYGYHLKVPVFKHTSPSVSITDPPHARKTCRNQPQYGTHTASLGIGHLVNNSFIELQALPNSGLVTRDVNNVDKQDDGAGRRMFHLQALKAMTMSTGGTNTATIRPGFEGTFVYLFVFGMLQVFN